VTRTEPKHAPEETLSFLARIFTWQRAAPSSNDPKERPVEAVAAQSAAFKSNKTDRSGPVEPAPTLVAKFTGVKDEGQQDGAQESNDDPPKDSREADGSDFGDDDEPRALTLSLMELQTKMEPKAQQKKSFP
jgi:hypothetical protein